jgi:hypothetical protein
MQKSTEISIDVALDGPAKTHLQPRKLVNCPYKVLLNGEIIDDFYDVRDAVAAARNAKSNQPYSHVKVSAEPSGRLIVEI